MKKLKLFPFYDNNFSETADEITDFLIKTSSSDNYHNINTVRLLKETINTTVIVPTNRVQYLLKFFILLSFKNKLNNNNNKTTAFIPNIKTINEVINEFRDFVIRDFKGEAQIINYEHKNIIIYDILKGFKELPQENPGAVFSLSEDITSLLNDFCNYNVDTEKLYNELAGKVSNGSHLPSLSDLICGYEGIEKQFNLILKADKAYKDKLKDLNLIDGELLIGSFVNADEPALNPVFKKHYRDKNIFIALINDVPPIYIKFLNKLKNNANNFTIILPYIYYPDFKKDIYPGYSIYFDFIAKMNAGIDEIQIKEQDVKNGQFRIKTDIANSLFKVAEQHRIPTGDNERGHLESKNCKEEEAANNKDSEDGCRRWDDVRIVSGLTIEDEVKNVCTLIKKDLLNGIKPQEIIIVLMEKSYAVPVYSAFSEFGFEANFLVPLNAFNDKDVLYFYKALEMANSNFNYKNIINFLYLRNNNQDIIDHIICIKDKLNISDGKDNLSNIINYTNKYCRLNRDLKENKDILTLIEELENLREYVYIDIDTPLSFEEFLRYLNKLTDFLFQPDFKNQTQARQNSFINQVIKTISYYDVLLKFKSKNTAEGCGNSSYEFKFNFKEYFLLITKLFENYEISPKIHNSGITVMGKLEGRYSFAKSAYIMGFSEDYFPAKRPKDYLLTPKIKERLGMPSYEKLELFQKSHFLSYMMLFDMVTFSYPVNIQGKRRLKSPYLFFIEDKLTNCEINETNETNETMEPNGLNLIKKINDEEEEKTERYSEVFNKIIQLERVYTNNLDKDENLNKHKDKEKEIGIFKRFKIDSISPKATYDYVKCGYKFYLDDIAKIKKVEWDFDEKSSLIFGVIIHAAMKKFLDLEIKPLVESGLAGNNVEFLKVQEIKTTYSDKFREIILNESGFDLLSYRYVEHTNKILELIFPKFLKNLFDKVKKYGFNKLDTECEKEREILFEENNSLKSIKLKGRIDLILSHTDKCHIDKRINPNSAKGKNIAWVYDFKTGYLQKSGFVEFVKNFVDNIIDNVKDDNIKNANDYLSSIQLCTYSYMLDDEYNVLGGSYILLSNSMEAQKTGYIKDIQYMGTTDTGDTGNFNSFNSYITITKLLIEQIISGKNELLPNLKSKDNCKYCDYINICY